VYCKFSFLILIITFHLISQFQFEPTLLTQSASPSLHLVLQSRSEHEQFIINVFEMCNEISDRTLYGKFEIQTGRIKMLR